MELSGSGSSPALAELVICVLFCAGVVVVVWRPRDDNATVVSLSRLRELKLRVNKWPKSHTIPDNPVFFKVTIECISQQRPLDRLFRD